MRLVPIGREGRVSLPPEELPDVARDVLMATLQLYEKVGYEPPWIGYLAIEAGECVGGCGFTHPPVGGRVEIACYTFPDHDLAAAGLSARRER